MFTISQVAIFSSGGLGRHREHHPVGLRAGALRPPGPCSLMAGVGPGNGCGRSGSARWRSRPPPLRCLGAADPTTRSPPGCADGKPPEARSTTRRSPRGLFHGANGQGCWSWLPENKPWRKSAGEFRSRCRARGLLFAGDGAGMRGGRASVGVAGAPRTASGAPPRCVRPRRPAHLTGG